VEFIINIIPGCYATAAKAFNEQKVIPAVMCSCFTEVLKLQLQLASR